ncbi:MAG: YraN family protein [Akkermansia sp.]|nr:YraN family protein [Akkermansia sp.]
MELRYTIAAHLRLLHKWNCPWGCNTVPKPAYTGAYAELVAASYLRAQGLKVLRHNFKWGKRGELDLVCRDADTLVAVEVKSSTSPRSGAPMRAVDATKRRLLRHGLNNWLRILHAPEPIPTRFDIVEIHLPPHAKPQVDWHRNAFTFTEGAETVR